MNNLDKLKLHLSEESITIIANHIASDLKDYIFNSILDVYTTFDVGHGLPHIATVIDSSLKLSKFYEVNTSMVLVVAIYHDIGMSKDRKYHHIHSKEILVNDSTLLKWFSIEEINIMGQACAQHRASSIVQPETIYGLIVSDADRTTDINDMIARCYNFTLKHYPTLSEDERYLRVYSHLTEKYGTNGYAKFYLEESKVVIMKPFLEAQKILKNELEFKSIYYKVLEIK